ncbi:osmoprotectant transport system permease protein [Limimonas halophila]|uniref:Osmoprotectant transport system permease protein n=1 Tax=Limimonas halophila TaxID=1082479 RepID=A0A1G7LPL7_9PROT|nr:ABC transporter permease [Limimonas halophila]SDF50940.1 osmoprotectant transport system permease protein [Limimonas halophila]
MAIPGLDRALRAGAIIGLLAAGALAQSSGLLPEVLSHWGDILYLGREHLYLVLISGGLAIGIGVPLGIVLTRRRMRGIAESVMQVVNLGQTIPTLAVLALSMSVLGIGAVPAIFALWIYSLLPIVRNTYQGILAVDPAILEAANGMGMRPLQMLWQVELPNALYVIIAGIRTALVINVGTVPLAFLIGGGGLGQLIFTGISLYNTGMMLAGAIPTAILAVIIDFLLGMGAYWGVPRGVNPLR